VGELNIVLATKNDMKQAEATRYRKRIWAVSFTVLVLTSSIGIFAYLQRAGVSTVNTGQIVSSASNGLLDSLLSAGFILLPITLLVSWVLHVVLNFLYLRDPAYMLEEGCYSDTSWLNLHDNQLVLLDHDSIVTADFNNEQAPAISEAYQNDSSCQDLQYVLNTQQLHRVLLSEINLLKSRKNENFIEIVSATDSIILQFQNAGTKEHALSYLTARLPETTSIRESKAPVWKSALPQLFVCGLFALSAVLSNQSGLAFVLALPVVFLLPGLLENLFDPIVHSEWNMKEIQATQQIDDASTHRQVA